MGAGREEVKIEMKAFDKKEKSSTKKALLVTMEPRDRYLYAVKCIYFEDRNRGLDKFYCEAFNNGIGDATVTQSDGLNLASSI